MIPWSFTADVAGFNAKARLQALAKMVVAAVTPGSGANVFESSVSRAAPSSPVGAVRTDLAAEPGPRRFA